jgi:hypothetical protein
LLVYVVYSNLSYPILCLMTVNAFTTWAKSSTNHTIKSVTVTIKCSLLIRSLSMTGNSKYKNPWSTVKQLFCTSLLKHLKNMFFSQNTSLPVEIFDPEIRSSGKVYNAALCRSAISDYLIGSRRLSLHNICTGTDL